MLSYVKVWEVMLKCESRTSLGAVQYVWQTGPVSMFCTYYFKNF